MSAAIFRSIRRPIFNRLAHGFGNHGLKNLDKRVALPDSNRPKTRLLSRSVWPEISPPYLSTFQLLVLSVRGLLTTPQGLVQRVPRPRHRRFLRCGRDSTGMDR